MFGQDEVRTGGEEVVDGLDTSATSRASSDPLARINLRALRRLAKKADRMRRRDVVRFEALAAAEGITPRRLRLLADAWAEGGVSGLHALGPGTQVDPSPMSRALEVIETWRARHFPLDALRSEVWRNRVTVWWLRPSSDPTEDLVEQPLMQLRRTKDGRWHLYRRAAQGEWWPVAVRGRRRRQSLSACLDAVRVDLLHHFWGAQGPPTDLAVGDARPDWLD